MLLINWVQFIKRMIALAIIHVFNCFPIKANKIFIFSYYGNQYGCNPKYISEYILKNYPNKQFDIVWSFNDIRNKHQINGIRITKTMSLRYFYELCTSKVIVTNFRTTDLFIKRKSQYYIQTWHSSLRLKKIEKDAESSLSNEYIRMAKRDSQKCDLLLSGCKLSTEIFKRAFWYKGDIIELGTPRNDIFFQDISVLKRKILNDLNIPFDAKLVLYAPTFRKDESLDVYDINYEIVSKKLKEKFGGEWVILVKLHPHLIAKSNQLTFTQNVIDATAFDDIQELLSISDILISDYSSLMFDFAITQRPCFLYVPDLKNYIKTERDLYFDIQALPFISAYSNKDLGDKIEAFDYEKYKKDLTKFLERIGSFEDGKASGKLLKHIDEVCFKQKRRRKNYATEAI
ncbi:CDP-glycerol glycerophosphotransferase family protein [Bacillus sp. USDA818B3_A]|uniref:CDP-glycerol glycerophosphotransferase family protein n=1 Tax=Bacillus sp. USDA818B3_A TaxID=2698834 RepID=UPI001367CC75|nr:CDP-glycerol glycerophosphotransferase family protein [Bacillus sp. USDA818B3_A]